MFFFRPLAGCRRTRRIIDVIPCFSTHHPLRSTGFHRLPRYYGVIRLLPEHRGHIAFSVPSTAEADSRRSLRVRTNNFPPFPSPLLSCHEWISGFALGGTLTQTDQPYGASLSFGTAVSLRLPSHTPSRVRLPRSEDRFRLVQLPLALGYLQMVPKGTCTLSYSSMPNAPPASRSRLKRAPSGLRSLSRCRHAPRYWPDGFRAKRKPRW